jgi:hypothetical protein
MRKRGEVAVFIAVWAALMIGVCVVQARCPRTTSGARSGSLRLSLH